MPASLIQDQVPTSALVLISHFFVFPNSHLAWSHILLQGLPNLGLVAIDSGTINMTVAYTKGMLDGCFHLPEGKEISVPLVGEEKGEGLF